MLTDSRIPLDRRINIYCFCAAIYHCVHMDNEKLILTLNPNAISNHNPKTNIYISVSKWPITAIQLLLKNRPLLHLNTVHLVRHK